MFQFIQKILPRKFQVNYLTFSNSLEKDETFSIK